MKLSRELADSYAILISSFESLDGPHMRDNPKMDIFPEAKPNVTFIVTPELSIKMRTL